MKAYALKNMSRRTFGTAAPKYTPDELRSKELEEASNRDNWVHLAREVVQGKNIFEHSSQWESARIGFAAIDRADCQAAAKIAEGEVKFLKRSGR